MKDAVTRVIVVNGAPGACPGAQAKLNARKVPGGSLDTTLFEEMTGAKIVGSVAAAFVVAFSCDYIIADKKLFGGTTPSTVSNKDWWEETDKKFQAWPRTAGPPVVMNPISRQNFIVKPRAE
ncbi:hypothetical protein R6Q57_017906 [Mikania cordata]